ncbi:hypothetical protein GCM10027403_23720 [Arthrobacter tecti]
MMSDEIDPPPALLEIASEVQRIVDNLPDGVIGTTYLRGHHVYMKLQGQGSPAFEVVLGSEAPEIVYDAQFIEHTTIDSDIEDHFEFARETASQIVDFILSKRKATLRKSRIFGRPFLCVPLSDGSEWKMKKFSAGTSSSAE